MKPKNIINSCPHNKGHIYIMNYQSNYNYSSYTQGDSCFLIYRYCKTCKEQMGFASPQDNLNNFEFSSKEMDNWFLDNDISQKITNPKG